MADLSTTLAVFFLLSAFSAVLAHSDLPQLALGSSTPDQLPESDPKFTPTETFLPSQKPQSEDSQPVRLVDFKPDDAAKSTDLKPDVRLEPLTVIDFPLVNRHLPGRFHHRLGRGCVHHRRFRPQDGKRGISYGKDMIVSDERTGPHSEISFVEFDPHQHGIGSVSLEDAEFKGPLHHHHHHHDDDEELERHRDNHHKHKHDDEDSDSDSDSDDDDEEHGLKTVEKLSGVYDDKHEKRKLKRSHDHDDDDDDEHEHKHKHKHGFLKRFKKLFDDDDDDDDDEHEHKHMHKHGFLKRFKKLFDDDDDDDEEHERYKHGHGAHGHHHKRPRFDDHEEVFEEDHHHRHHGHGHEHHRHEHDHHGGFMIMEKLRRFLDHF